MKETITAKVKEVDKESGKPILDKETGKPVEHEISGEYDFGDDHKSMVADFGEDVVFHHSRSNMRVAFQGALRMMFLQGKKGAELVSAIDAWEMPSGKPRGKSKLERAKETIGKLSEAERAQFLEEIGL